MMNRTLQSSATSGKKHDTKEDEILEDWVSRLPDEILVNIISRLTLKEGARTCVLSSRWKYLWTFTTCLNFEAPESWSYMMPASEFEEEKSKYIDFVNKVLESHRGSSVNEFRVCSLGLNDSHESMITNWIYTAISKRVQEFDLGLTNCIGPQYTFPKHFYNTLKTPYGLSSIKSLRSLCLKYVNVTKEILELFIYNCPLLDRLHVTESSDLTGLKVIGSSIQLKYLVIHHCSNLESVEISAPSLLSFEYHGIETKLLVENVPQLFDVSIHWWYEVDWLWHNISPIVSCFPQLKSLDLGFKLEEVLTLFSKHELPNLRCLKLSFYPCAHESIHCLTRILELCPFLEKLVLKLDVFPHPGAEEHGIPQCPLQHLKVVELLWFVGMPFHFEVADYLLKNAPALEKMNVKPFYREKEERAKNCVNILEAKLPQGVQLVVL